MTTGSNVTTEQLWVRRPFDAADEVYVGTDTSGAPLSVTVTRLGRQLTRVGNTPAVLEPPPRPTSFDVRLDRVASAAVRGRLLAVRGTRLVAGARCRVYRSRQSLAADVFSARPAARAYVDSCIDDRGLLLDEVRVAGGKVAQRRRAVSVTIGAGDHSFDTTGTSVPLAGGGGAVVAITDASRPPGSPFWELSEPPAGFTHVGRFAVVFPRPPALGGQPPPPVATAVEDVYVRGADAVIVENNNGAGAAPGTLSLGPRSSTLTVSRRNGTTVVIIASLPPAELTALARRLREQPPGTITTVPEQPPVR